MKTCLMIFTLLNTCKNYEKMGFSNTTMQVVFLYCDFEEDFTYTVS